MRTIASLTLGLLLALPLGAQQIPQTNPEDVGMSSARLQRLTEMLDRYVENERLPGGVVLVVRRGKVAYHHAFGARDRERRARMTEDAIFRIASQSKAPVSVGIMMLQEKVKRERMNDAALRNEMEPDPKSQLYIPPPTINELSEPFGNSVHQTRSGL